MDFQEADRRYAELKHQVDAQRQRLMVQDDEGRWWARSPNNDEWNYYDGSAWVPGTPPGYQEVVPEPTSSPIRTLPPSRPEDTENGENGHQRVSPWIPVARLSGIALVGIVLIVWVLAPYLQGEPAPSNHGESAPGGAAFDTMFIHRATPENISAQSTYLDSPLTNDDPNVILFVTQNWNPGGGTGTYNDHSIGVWYSTDRQRWAIFNQDRETMPEGVAFNVAVLINPTKAE